MTSRTPHSSRRPELLLQDVFYAPDAVQEAAQAFRGVCRLRLRRRDAATAVALDHGTPRDLREFANYALALSERIRRRIGSGSTNNG